MSPVFSQFQFNRDKAVLWSEPRGKVLMLTHTPAGPVILYGQTFWTCPTRPQALQTEWRHLSLTLNTDLLNLYLYWAMMGFARSIWIQTLANFPHCHWTGYREANQPESDKRNSFFRTIVLRMTMTPRTEAPTKTAAFTVPPKKGYAERYLSSVYW